MSQSTIGVLDNDSFALEKIVSILPQICPMLKVVWSTTSSQEAIRRCLDTLWRPDILLIDVELDDTTAMEVCLQIRERIKHMPILAISSYSPRKYAAALARVGAQGILVKGDIPQMREAFCCILTGKTFSPITDIIFPSPSEGYENLQQQQITPAVLEALTPLQLEILQLVAQGCSTERIAQLKFMAPATVRSHTRAIRNKLHARTLSHAVAIWMSQTSADVHKRAV